MHPINDSSFENNGKNMLLPDCMKGIVSFRKNFQSERGGGRGEKNVNKNLKVQKERYRAITIASYE